jgi:hypothetical protein
VAGAFGNQGKHHQAKFAMVEHAARSAPKPVPAAPVMVMITVATAVLVAKIAVFE